MGRRKKDKPDFVSKPIGNEIPFRYENRLF